jgi:sugar phosphate isomerase/epimerase
MKDFKMPTRTGKFPIGFRRGWGPWQKDLQSVCAWAKQNGFESFDLSLATANDIAIVANAGLQLGSVDLMQAGDITHTDAGKRKEIQAANLAYIKESTAAGAKVFFTVVGGDPTKKRSENYKIAVESFAPLTEAAAAAGATIAVEGYPGGVPHLALLCTTPETCRAMLKDLPRGLSINYDPSHLIRLGVDHVRFLKEFVAHVAHVHGKDTELFPEAVYELGLYQPSAFQPGHGFGEFAWRYTLPGHGIARWTEIFKVLTTTGYKGLVSIELEDENFNGTEAGEKAGLVNALNFLSGA